MFEISENNLMNLMNQIRMIITKKWLTGVEIETIRREVNKVTDETINVPNRIIEETIEEVIQEDVEIRNNSEDRVGDTVEGMLTEIELDDENKMLLTRLREILRQDNKGKIYNLRYIDRGRVKRETLKINGLLKYVKIRNITDLRNLIQAAAILVGEGVDAKEPKKKVEKEPYWKRRISSDIKRLRKDLSRIESWFKGEWKNGRRFEKYELDKRYRLKAKGFNMVIEEMKQRILAKASKVKRYENRIRQFHDNRLFSSNQGRFFKNLDGGENKTIPPNPEEATQFWTNIWGSQISHNDKAEWIGQVEEKLQGIRQEDIVVTLGSVKDKLKSMPDWKGAGPDGIQGYWLKTLSSLHDNLAKTLDECLRKSEVPDWMVEGRTILVMKDPLKGADVGNYRPIACLNLIWKLLTGVFSENTYAYLDENKLLPIEQKGCRKKCQGTKDHLAIDKCILKNCKRRKTNLEMAWIDYKKAYDMVPHSWIIKTMKMLGIADNLIDLISRSMSKWRTNLYSDNKFLGSVDISRGIFQGDSISPLLFVIALIPITYVLRETNMGYQLEKDGPGINHLFFMDDLKMFAKNNNEIDSLVQTVRQCSDDIGMEFGIAKCAVVSIKRGKRVRSEGIELPDGEEMMEPDSDGYKYLGVLELDTILCKEMKIKVKKVYLKRLKLLLKSKLNGRNLFLAINSWAVAVVRYSAAFIDWTKDETRELDRQTRKTIGEKSCSPPEV